MQILMCQGQYAPAGTFYCRDSGGGVESRCCLEFGFTHWVGHWPSQRLENLEEANGVREEQALFNL